MMRHAKCKISTARTRNTEVLFSPYCTAMFDLVQYGSIADLQCHFELIWQRCRVRSVLAEVSITFWGLKMMCFPRRVDEVALLVNTIGTLFSQLCNSNQLRADYIRRLMLRWIFNPDMSPTIRGRNKHSVTSLYLQKKESHWFGKKIQCWRDVS